jgi:hypothetical protein
MLCQHARCELPFSFLFSATIYNLIVHGIDHANIAELLIL